MAGLASESLTLSGGLPNSAMDDPTAVRTLARSGYSGFYLAVEVPGSVRAESLWTTAD